MTSILRAADHPLTLALVGPTASGKSDLAVGLARTLGGEVVNADSMQLYRGMDIGTAKLSPVERQGVPHHLIDVLDVDQTATVAEFQAMAREAVADCHRRGVVPIVVGGSVLYMRAVVDRLEFPGTDPDVRARLEDEAAEKGSAVLHERLSRLDPESARHIQPSNARRIVRALEVVEITGRPFKARMPDYAYALPGVFQLGLSLDRTVLDQRIEERVDRMWESGLVDEVRRLTRHGLREGRTASCALGYAQVLRHLSGEWPEQEAREETIRATRRFARRQGSWFRRDPRICWLDALAPDLVAQSLNVIETTETG